MPLSTNMIVSIGVFSFSCVSAREWWQFSIMCILQSIKERNMHQTWGFAVKRARDIVKYVNIYSQHLTSATVEPSLKVSKLPEQC